MHSSHQVLILESSQFSFSLIKQFHTKSYPDLLEYQNGCSIHNQEENIMYFQIEDPGGKVLDITRNTNNEKHVTSFKFSQNEYKDSQIWYWHKYFGDYGYIGPKRYYTDAKVLSMLTGKSKLI